METVKKYNQVVHGRKLDALRLRYAKYLTLLQLGGDRALNGPTLKKKNDTDSFLRELSPHLRSSHYFALPEGYQTYLFVGVYGGGGRGGGKSQWEI